MFRQMRRSRQQLSQEDCISILERGRSGVLALLGDDDYPYAVPLNYVYSDGRLFFHSAKTGHKIDAIMRHSRASFCVVDSDEPVPQEYTTYFRSVIVFGSMLIIEDDSEKRAAITALAKKYNPTDSEHDRNATIDREFPPLCMLEMDIHHISGKEAIELVRMRSAFTVVQADSQLLLDECKRVRNEVFVLERGVDPSIEQDEQDVLGGECVHFLIKKGSETVGAFRCRQSVDAVILQRFCVKKEHRGSGAGSAALRFTEQFFRTNGAARIELDSKCESADFYLKNGYKAVSQPFIEADIPHVKMIKEL